MSVNSVRMILVSLGFLVGCGVLRQSKSDSPTNQNSTRAKSNKPKYRTENTHLAKEQDCYKPTDDELCTIAKQILTFTNEERQKQGLKPFKLHAGWSYTASLWSSSQAEVSKISHDGFPVDRESIYEKEFGTIEQPALAAENVGRIKPAGADDLVAIASKLNQGWWNSPSHRRNLVGSYSHIGIGIAFGTDGFHYGTQIFAHPPDDENIEQEENTTL